MRFLSLLSLQIRHSYYADGLCQDFRIEPTADCARLLRNARSIAKPRPGGIQILTPVTGDGEPFIPFPEDMTLGFHLRLANPELALFTDLAHWNQLAAPLYTNADPAPPSGQPGGQPDDRPGGGLTLVSNPAGSRLARGVFADVEVRGVDPRWLRAGGAAFHIAFPSRQARWVYYFVTDIERGQLRLVDNVASAGDAPLVFSDSNRTELSQEPDPTDEVAAALARQYPRQRRLRFISDEPVPCRQRPRKHLEIQLDGERLCGALPNPLPRNQTTIDMEIAGTLQPRDSLFRVVKYLSYRPPGSEPQEANPQEANSRRP